MRVSDTRRSILVNSSNKRKSTANLVKSRLAGFFFFNLFFHKKHHFSKKFDMNLT